MVLIHHHHYYMCLKNVINILLLLFLFSCSKKNASIDFEHVYIYASSEDKILLQEIVEKELFDEAYYTPQLELRHKPVWKKYGDFLDRPSQSKIVLISLSNPADTTADIITEHLFSGLNSNEKIISIDNYFNQNQVLVALKYHNINDFNNELIHYKAWILSLLDQNDRFAMKDVAYRAGINDTLSSMVLDMFAAAVNIPMDYQLIKQNTLDNHLWLGRGYPYRWMYFFDDDEKHYTTPASSWSRIGSQFSDFLDVEIIDYGASFSKSPTQIKGVYGTKLSSDNGTGGPFFSKIIKDYKIGKVLVVSGFVNFPGKSKIFHIKELEYILNNIKYKDE